MAGRRSLEAHEGECLRWRLWGCPLFNGSPTTLLAIKHLKGDHNERFKREARALAALNHPHICQLYDVGLDYLVMEYIEGAPLKNPLPTEEVVRLAIQIASALEEAHSKGIIHRDLKLGGRFQNSSSRP